jgi:hypothetical protein
VVEGSAGKVLELVVFKLNDGVSRDQFLGTNDAASAWMRSQPGFISHELLYDAEGDRWIEIAWWETMEDARGAAELAMTSESCAPMFALIDMESALMAHGEPAIAPVHAAPTRAGT